MQQIRTQGAIDLEDHARPNKPQKSRFNLSRTINLTAEPGMIIPIDVFPVLPGDDLDIDTEMIMDTLPLAAPSLTRYKVTVHWYYMKARDTWKGFKTFWTRGRTGKITDKVVPTINAKLRIRAEWTQKIKNTDQICDCYALGYHSLTSYLTGYPNDISGDPRGTGTEIILNQTKPYTIVPKLEQTLRNEVINLEKTEHKNISQNPLINAMPYVMYQSIVKNNYVNENLLQDNTALFPEEGDDDWILPYNATTVNFIGRGETNNDEWNDALPQNPSDWTYDYTGIYHNTDKRVRLDLLRYAMFDDDYFTSGLPWLQRGEAKTLDVDITDLSGEITTTTTAISQAVRTGQTQGYQELQSSGGSLSVPGSQALYTGAINLMSAPIANALSVSMQGNAQTTLTTNALREMIALQVWMERNARVNGSYNMMTYQHWMVNPNSEEHKPIYFGGSVDYVTFTNVIQNSESTENSPLGTTAGFGTAGGSSRVGHIRCNDYGYVMGILIIRQNTQYTQGFEHFWRHEQVFEQMVQPEFQGLSPEPIYNDEIYISGDENEDKGLFCYQERYQYLKQRINANRGLFTASPTRDRLFSAYTQARWFEEKPTFSYQFLVMSPDNIRRDMLAYPNYPMFRIQFATKAYVTRELAYASEPNTFGF